MSKKYNPFYENKNVKPVKIMVMTPELIKSMHITDSRHIIIGISKENIIKKDTSYIESFFKTFEEVPEVAYDFDILITTDAYDNSPRELYLIPEWNEYITMAFKKYPSCAMFLNGQSVNLIIMSMCTLSAKAVPGTKNHNVQLLTDKLREFIGDACGRCKDINLDMKYQDKFTETISRIIGE